MDGEREFRGNSRSGLSKENQPEDTPPHHLPKGRDEEGCVHPPDTLTRGLTLRQSRDGCLPEPFPNVPDTQQKLFPELQLTEQKRFCSCPKCITFGQRLVFEPSFHAQSAPLCSDVIFFLTSSSLFGGSRLFCFKESRHSERIVFVLNKTDIQDFSRNDTLAAQSRKIFMDNS